MDEKDLLAAVPLIPVDRVRIRDRGAVRRPSGLAGQGPVELDHAIEHPLGDQLACTLRERSPLFVICTGAEPSSRAEKSSHEPNGEPGTSAAYASCGAV